jgi:trans-aconitate 2-methyltransferase
MHRRVRFELRGSDRVSWSPSLYEGQHSFVWKYGEDLLPLLDPREGERMVDLGCGTGHLTARIAESGAEVTGIDNSPDMIGQARQNYPGLRFALADITSFEVPQPVDGVFSNAALHWVTDADGAAEAIAGALKPGGRFVAEFGGKRNVAQVLAAVEDAAAAAGFTTPNPWYFPSIGEYAAVLERHGMEVRAAWHFDRMTPLDGSMEEWLEMFGAKLLAGIPAGSVRRQVIADAVERMRGTLSRNGQWHVDYVRIRVAAVRQA